MALIVQNTIKKIGRNDLCHCDSGKKYKKCCMVEDCNSDFASNNVIDLAWQKVLKAQKEVMDNHLIPYVEKSFSSKTIQRVWTDFILGTDLEEDMYEIIWHTMFFPWLLFNWMIDEDIAYSSISRFTNNSVTANTKHKITKQTIADRYLEKYSNNMSNAQCDFINAVQNSYYSIYKVIDIVGNALTLVDMLLDTKHIVKELQTAHIADIGDIISTRIVTLGDQSICFCTVPCILDVDQTELCELKDFLELKSKGNLTPEFLCSKDAMNTIICFCLEELDAQTEYSDDFEESIELLKALKMLTTMNSALLGQDNDDDEHKFYILHYNLFISPEQALSKLLPLTVENYDGEILESAERDKTGMITSIEFSWFQKNNDLQNDASQDSILNGEREHNTLGYIIIEPNKLIVEVASEEMSNRTQTILQQYLKVGVQVDSDVEFVRMEVDSLNKILDEAENILQTYKNLNLNLDEDEDD